MQEGHELVCGKSIPGKEPTNVKTSAGAVWCSRKGELCGWGRAVGTEDKSRVSGGDRSYVFPLGCGFYFTRALN